MGSIIRFRADKNLKEKHMVIVQAKELQLFVQPFPKQSVYNESKHKSNNVSRFSPASPLLLHCWRSTAQRDPCREQQGTSAYFLH